MSQVALGTVALVAAASLLLGHAMASRDSVGENLLRVAIDTNGASSTASCQLLVLADLVVGAFSAERILAQPPERAVPTSTAVLVDGGNVTRTSTSTCEQPMGRVQLLSGAAAGWDEGGAPSGSAWGAVAPAAGVSVLTNKARIHLEGDGPSAAAGCQLLVAIDALVLSASIDEPGTGTVETLPVATQVDGAVERAEADCSQRMELLDIILSS